MKMLIKIAWRNVWRNKFRSIVVIMAIASGMIGGLFSSAWMLGMAQQRVDSAFDIEMPHIQIQDSTFVNNFDIKKTIKNCDQKTQEILKFDSVSQVNTKIICSAMAATASKNWGVIIYGINPEEYEKMYNMSDQILDSSGTFLKDDYSNSIVVSKALAKELKLKLKSKIVVTFQDYNGEISGAVFKVRGIYKTDNTAFDKMFVFAKESYLRDNLKLPANEYHQIDVKVDDYKFAVQTKKKLQKVFPDLRVENWEIFSPMLSVLSSYMDYTMYIFLSIILAALGFGIVNTMLMVILERTKEIGMLMAIGLNKKKLFSVIMFETVILSLVGAFFGEIISYFLINYFSGVGIDLSAYSEGLEAVGYSAISYPQLAYESYFEVTIMVFITAIISSIYPAVKALKLNPNEAIRTN